MHRFHSFFIELSHSISEEGNGNVERATCISRLVFSDKKLNLQEGIILLLHTRNDVIGTARFFTP